MNISARLLIHLCRLAVMLTLIAHAEADPIIGNANFAGTASVVQSNGISTLTFDNPMTFTFGTGDYAAVPAGTPVPFAPISWMESGALLNPNTPLWTMTVDGTTYQLSLFQASIFTMSSTELFIQGFGVAHVSGAINRDPTAYILRIHGHGANFNYTVAVPEPQPVAYVFCTAAALALWRWRRAQRT
jgi:hypothetical protein